MQSTLGEQLRKRTREGALYEKLPQGKIRCFACGHRCVIPPGREGICRVRFNENGILHVPWGYVDGLQLDPIEKKPFFHALPGAMTFSFGMLGCDFHCGYCQNWVTSQALRDPVAGTPPLSISPKEFVDLAARYEARAVTSTYNEPLITSEWAVAIFKEAKARGLVCSFVSNGNATPEALDYIRPWVDLYKIDLKSFKDSAYRLLGGVLQHVLDGIKVVHEKKFWLEVVTLIVPDFNDTSEELRDMARFIKSVSPDIPWHVTAFHKNYRMTDHNNTTARKLVQAAEIGYEEGLHYVYAGNLSGEVGDYEDTRCPSCQKVLIERSGYEILSNKIRNGACYHCKTPIAGYWE
jgi:pyruvate formate lyase activating enzyme